MDVEREQGGEASAAEEQRGGEEDREEEDDCYRVATKHAYLLKKVHAWGV